MGTREQALENSGFRKGHQKYGGREKGSLNQKTILLNEIAKIEAEQGINFWNVVIKIALKNAQDATDTSLLRELVKKLLPDQVEGNFNFEGFEFANE